MASQSHQVLCPSISERISVVGIALGTPLDLVNERVGGSDVVEQFALAIIVYGSYPVLYPDAAAVPWQQQ